MSEFLLKWSKPAHQGFGGTLGDERKTGNLLKSFSVQTDMDEPNVWHGVPVTLTSVEKGHYGNPSDGCLEDEVRVEMDHGHACMPAIKSTGLTAVSTGLPEPNCKVGGAHPVEDNGCPTDASVPRGSKAFPICLAKGNTADPYTNDEFVCVLVCPCNKLGADGQCSSDSNAHCPAGATCKLGDLRHRGQGVCSFNTTSSIVV